MKVGDLVNYVGDAFAGPSTGGIVMDVRVVGGSAWLGYDQTPTEHCEVFWATHLITNWVATKMLERVGQ